MFVEKTIKNLIVGFVLMSVSLVQLPGQAVCDPTLKLTGSVGGVCLPSVKAKCINDCAIRCGDDGQCIFGCLVGQDYSIDRCSADCNGFSARCLSSCLATIDCINLSCADVTGELKINRGTVVYNRATLRWEQTILLANLSCINLTNLVFRLEALGPDWTVANADGLTASGTSYKILAKLDSLATASVRLQFNHTGTQALTYTTRVTGNGN